MPRMSARSGFPRTRGTPRPPCCDLSSKSGCSRRAAASSPCAASVLCGFWRATSTKHCPPHRTRPSSPRDDSPSSASMATPTRAPSRPSTRCIGTSASAASSSWTTIWTGSAPDMRRSTSADAMASRAPLSPSTTSECASESGMRARCRGAFGGARPLNWERLESARVAANRPPIFGLARFGRSFLGVALWHWPTCALLSVGCCIL
mmetsp:Transcript_112049/g.323724  ORF Transcript_112049/g.323724 Transcript_112049/m.323724 type:complete len:206 (+) Transcript_112049:712-1329(+)